MALLAILLLLGCVLSSATAEFNVCAYEDATNSKTCNALESSGEGSCVWVTDSVDCALKLKAGKANIASFTAEQALVVARYLNDTVLASGEIRHQNHMTDEFAFQAVVIVKSDFKGGLDKLSGKNFCHPGTKYEQSWSKRVLTEFERRVVKSKCSSKQGFAAEDEVLSLSSYFGKSCRPGVWTDGDDKLDQQLKKKYSKLCDLCDNKAKCEYSDAVDPHQSALKCLAYMGGEVAYVSLNHSREYFALNANGTGKADAGNFKYLCPDGQTESIYKEHPCTWLQQPWPVVVTHRNVSDEFKNNMYEGVAYLKQNWKDTLRDILTQGNGKIVGNQTGLISYVRKGRDIPDTEKDVCNRNFKWCTVSFEETQKCDWLSTAARSVGVTPGLACVQGSNTFDCFEKLKNNKADIISIDSNYGYIARKTYDLAPVLYHTTAVDRSFVIAVIKENTTSTITNFESLRNAKICLPEYGGIAWLSLIVFGKEYGALADNQCDYGAAISTFFGEGCVPGTRDNYHGVTRRVKQNKLCALCMSTERSSTAATCEAGNENKFYGDVGALRCLQSKGDIAFIERVDKTVLAQHQLKERDFRVLCRKNSLAPNTGFDVEEDCALSVTVDSETISRTNDADKPAYKLFLRTLAEWFGQENTPNILDMFSSFNDKKDLIFKSNTVDFDDTDNPNNKYTKNYHKLFSDVDQCVKTSSAGSVNLSGVLLMTLIVVVIGMLIEF